VGNDLPALEFFVRNVINHDLNTYSKTNMKKFIVTDNFMSTKWIGIGDFKAL